MLLKKEAIGIFIEFLVALLINDVQQHLKDETRKRKTPLYQQNESI
jgi:hypothetical protein